MFESIYINSSMERLLLSFLVMSGSVVLGKLLFKSIQKRIKYYLKKGMKGLVRILEKPFYLAITALSLWWVLSMVTLHLLSVAL